MSSLLPPFALLPTYPTTSFFSIALSPLLLLFPLMAIVAVLPILLAQHHFVLQPPMILSPFLAL